MSFVEALLHPSLLVALFIYALLNLGLLWAEHRWHEHLGASRVGEWIVEHILIGVARAFILLVFIGVAYPVLYGVAEAPPLFQLLGAGEHRINTLINVAFLVSLVFPLLPVIGAIPGVVLPVQGAAAAALLFAWLAHSQGVTVTVWPGWTVAGLMLAWAILAQRLAVRAARMFGAAADRRMGYRDSEKLIYELTILFLQAPAILLYTLALGRQLIP